MIKNNECIVDEDYNQDQEYMLSLTNKKVEQHIAYLLGMIGVLFTFVNIPAKYDTLIIKYNLNILFFLFLISFFIHNTGKLIYWSVINNFILTHRPHKIQIDEDKEKIYRANTKWAFLEAAKKDILQKPPYDTIKRSKFEKSRIYIARIFSSIIVFLVCSFLSVLIWIISILR